MSFLVEKIEEYKQTVIKKKTLWCESHNYKYMNDTESYVKEDVDKQNMKYQLRDGIQKAMGGKWYRLKDDTRQAIDMICFLSREKGFFYATAETLAETHNITAKTMRNVFSELEELGQVIKFSKRQQNGGKGRGKPIYVFVNHPYFERWIKLNEPKLHDFLNNFHNDFHNHFHNENAEIPCESKSEGTKKVPTYCLPSFLSLKQEKDIINNAYNPYWEIMQKNEVRQSIKQHVGYRVDDMLIKDPLLTDVLIKFVDMENDNLIKLTPEKIERIKIFVEHQIIQAIEQREITINHMSSYVGAVMENIKTKALLIEDERNKQPQQTQARTVSFYNWLDETPVGTAPTEEAPVYTAPFNSFSMDGYLDVI